MTAYEMGRRVLVLPILGLQAQKQAEREVGRSSTFPLPGQETPDGTSGLCGSDCFSCRAPGFWVKMEHRTMARGPRQRSTWLGHVLSVLQAHARPEPWRRRGEERPLLPQLAGPELFRIFGAQGKWRKRDNGRGTHSSSAS